MRQSAIETLDLFVKTCNNERIEDYESLMELIGNKIPDRNKEGILFVNKVSDLEIVNNVFKDCIEAIKFCFDNELLAYLPDRFILRDNTAAFVLESDGPSTIHLKRALYKDIDKINNPLNDSEPKRESIERVSKEILFLLNNKPSDDFSTYKSKYQNLEVHIYEIYLYFLQYGIIGLMAKKEQDKFQKELENFEIKRAELDVLLNKARENESVNQTENYIKDFHELASIARKKSTKWFWGTMGSAFLVIISYLSIFLYLLEEDNITFSTITTKIFFGLFVFLLVSLTQKQYKIHKNQEIVNQQKSVILSSYLALQESSKGIDEQARQKLLEVLTKTIFGISDPGVFKKDVLLSQSLSDFIKNNGGK